MKKITGIIAIMLSFSLLLVGCSNTGTTEKDSSETTQTTDCLGKVTAIDGNTVTVAVMSLQTDNPVNNGSDGVQGGNIPSMPNGNGSDIQSLDGATDGEQTPPDMPSGNGGDVPAMPDGNGGQMPDMPNGNGGDVPTMPDGGDIPSMPTNSDGGDVPAMPDGGDMPSMPTNSDGTVPTRPDDSFDPMQSAESRTITITDTSILYKTENNAETQAALSDISVGSLLKITYNGDTVVKIVIGSESDFGIGGGQGGQDGQGGQGGGSLSSVIYDGATTISASATETDKTYQTETVDQSALLISTSDSVTITNPTVTKSGDSEGGDNCNFYGQNAAVLVKDGSTTTITGGTVSTSATGANGVFSYGGNGGQNGAAGDGTTVIISDTTITTTGSGSGGIMTTGGGITKATNLTVTTSGQSSAAIRTDRGGGTVTVDKGTYTTNGLGSPAIYSTADITVSNATLVSNLSEGVCIEGLNSITLNNCNMTANNTKCNGNATFNDTIMMYQSMSGDAASGTSSFTMTGGSLTSKNGHVFHVTNTNAVISLNSVTITNEDSANVLLSVCDDGWSGGTNTATVNASAQTLSGSVLVGDNSTLTLTLSDNSSFTGSISGKIENASGKTVSTEVGTVSVTLDGTSTWTLTADSYITGFTGDTANVIMNGYTLYVNGVALQ